ncbi:RXT2-like protein [Morchella snyderi]|nr:RXT2-like protein [Morchella snyderi]
MSAAQDKRKTLNAIIELKRALAQTSDGSESDDSISYPSNRGRKLKRKARFVHEGALNDAKGPRTYKEEIEYFGKRRKIIWRNRRARHRAADRDSASDDSDASDSNGSAVDEDDPYAEVKLDKILAPLESAADLPSHPSLAHIYTTTTLNELLQQSLDKLCEEHAHTMKLKNLLTVFLGDDPYVNLEKMTWDNEDYLSQARERSQQLLRELAGGAAAHDPDSARGSISGPSPAKPAKPTEADTDMADADADAEADANPDPDPEDDAHNENAASSATLEYAAPPPPLDDDPDATQEYKMEEILPDSPPPRRMATRSTQHAADGTPPGATATATATATAIAAAAPPPEIDAFFFPPAYSVDRDFGLPPAEAEDTRCLLSTAVQRQDEFLRGLGKVRDGLLRAERLRKGVWGWCRAMEGTRDYVLGGGSGGGEVEEVVGTALSDGEDWYDAEAWGLEEALEKGKEEEEDGVETVVQGKKTRGRRGVGN